MAIDKSALTSIQEVDPDGSMGLLKEVVKLFTESIPSELNDLQKLHESDDRDNLALNAHRFKSSCQNVGAMEMAKLLSQLELEKASLTVEKREAILKEISSLAKSAEDELRSLVG